MRQASRSIEVEIEPARARRSLADEWRALEERADCSFFLSWRWIGTWLAELPADVELLCLRARRGGETVGLALFSWREVRRRRLVRARQLHLNATGHLFFDQLTIEYNDFLVDRRVAGETRQAMLDALAGWDELWDELLLNGVAPAFADRLAGSTGRILMRYRSTYPYVDLGAIDDPACLEGLGRNTRHQIRRTHRLLGDPRLEQARDAGEGAAFFDGLVAQHDAIWQARGKAGAFWNGFLLGFHRRLIADGVPGGQVQLLRTRGGDGAVIGHLYNFLYRGRVYSYQSGFARYADNRVKPGLLSHHLAIAMNRAAGQRYYDFMAVDMRYKRSLSNRTGELAWMVLQRPALRFAIEQHLREAVQHLAAAARRLLGRHRPADEMPHGD